MCTARGIIFGATRLSPADVKGKWVLEVGSQDVNGSLRPIIESWLPAEYLGVDASPGPGVDLVCRAEAVKDRLGAESFDVVISTDTIEHIRDWRAAVSNLKAVCKRNGILLVTTCSRGFPYHGYPYDFWRYEPSDLAHVFSDCVIEFLETDQSGPVIFLKARKPEAFAECDLSGTELYSVIVRRRLQELDDRAVEGFHRRYRRRMRLRKLEKWLKQLFRRPE